MVGWSVQWCRSKFYFEGRKFFPSQGGPEGPNPDAGRAESGGGALPQKLEGLGERCKLSQPAGSEVEPRKFGAT